MHQLKFEKRYLKDLEAIPPNARQPIKDKVSKLADNPRPDGCVKLKGERKLPLYRIRIGDYRVIYAIQDQQLIVLVIQVGHRKGIYK